MKIFLFIIILIISSQQMISIEEYYNVNYNKDDYRILRMSEVSQDYFDGVYFWNIDTCTTVTSDPYDQCAKIILALDDEYVFYEIYGFDKSNFNLLVSRHSLRIDVDNVIKYGQFYLKTNILQNDDDYYYFIKNYVQLLDITEQKFQIRFGHSNPNAMSDEKNLKELFKNEKQNEIIFSLENRIYTINLFVWDELDGSLTRYTLNVDEHGKCELKDSYIMIDKIGCWRRYSN